jgi:methionyl-tRNA synthetase
LVHECNGQFGFANGRALQAALEARATTGKPAEGDIRTFDFAAMTAAAVRRYADAMERLDLAAATAEGLGIVHTVDEFITYSAPFTLAKKMAEIEHGGTALASILYSCAEALRIASLLLAPVMPQKTAALWTTWGCTHLKEPGNANAGFVAPLAALAAWGGDHGFKEGDRITKGEAMFMRADLAEPAPGS